METGAITETSSNLSYLLSKGMKAGLTLREAETMPYRKLFAFVNGYKALHSEEMLDLLYVVANPSLLKTKNGQKEYPKLFKVFEKNIKNFGTKTITIEADLSQLIRMRQEQLAKKNGGK